MKGFSLDWRNNEAEVESGSFSGKCSFLEPSWLFPRKNPHRDFSSITRFLAHRGCRKKRFLFHVRASVGACSGSLRDRDQRYSFRGSRLQRLHWPWSRGGDQGVADQTRNDNSGQARLSSARQT